MPDLVRELIAELDPEALRTFYKKRIVFCEEATDSRLRKLTIKGCRKTLTPNQHPNDGIFFETDFKTGELSQFTHFFKTERPKTDFVFILQRDGNYHLVIADMKSSAQGDNDRSDKQYQSTKRFVQYLADCLAERLTPENSRFYKVLFFPDLPAIACSDPITQQQAPPAISEKDVFTPEESFHFRVQAYQGEAEVLLSDILQRIPKIPNAGSHAE